MTAESFAYWLQGYFEISNPISINPEQVKVIKEHLQLVFKKETKTTVAPIQPKLQQPFGWSNSKWGDYAYCYGNVNSSPFYSNLNNVSC